MVDVKSVQISKNYIMDYLFNLSGDFDEDHMIYYVQWVHTDRATHSKMVADTPTFIENFVLSLENLRPHSFISGV